MQRLKIATHEDISDIVRMVVDFHSQSPYRDIAADPSHISSIAAQLIELDDSIIVLSQEDEITVGMVAGRACPGLFANVLQAMELMFWVTPEHRGGAHGKKLKEAYEYWARNVMKVKIVTLSALEDKLLPVLTRLYRKDGYIPAEHQFMKVF